MIVDEIRLEQLGRREEFDWFARGELDAGLIADLRLFSRGDIEHYRPLAPLLEAAGCHHLAEALNELDQDFHTWDEWRDLALEDIDFALPEGAPFLLAGEGRLGTPDKVHESETASRSISLLPTTSLPPSELERQVAIGVRHLVVAWRSSWWLDVYGEFASYLDSKQRLLLSTERVKVCQPGETVT